jgi:DNA-binding CsgD family transcriptional regulator
MRVVMNQSCNPCAAEKRRKRYYLPNSKTIYFTEAEVSCLRLLLQGKSYAETAEILQLSIRTVEFYSQNMQAKLACNNKYSLLHYFKVLRTHYALPWLTSY